MHNAVQSVVHSEDQVVGVQHGGRLADLRVLVIVSCALNDHAPSVFIIVHSLLTKESHGRGIQITKQNSERVIVRIFNAREEGDYWADSVFQPHLVDVALTDLSGLFLSTLKAAEAQNSVVVSGLTRLCNQVRESEALYTGFRDSINSADIVANWVSVASCQAVAHNNGRPVQITAT